MTTKPKTHSNILWHFTGGPAWDSKKQRQSKLLKTDEKAYEIALAILQSKSLRLGGFHEVVKVILPNYRIYDRKTKTFKNKKNHKVELKTCPVCCIADIPESGLSHHAKRYGKMGIGFKRAAILKAGFNPVFYTLHTTEIAKNFFSAQAGLNSVDIFDVESEVENVLDDIRSNLCSRCEEDVDLDGSSISTEAENQLEEVHSSLDDLENIMSYVKTFNVNEFNSIYAEREWRCLRQFNFTFDDVDTLLFPTKMMLDDFKKSTSKLKLPLRIKLKVFPTK